MIFRNAEIQTRAVVLPSQVKKLHTTASWEYLGLSFNAGLWPQAGFANDVIIGLIDTGRYAQYLLLIFSDLQTSGSLTTVPAPTRRCD
jgi:hypothetical protein